MFPFPFKRNESHRVNEAHHKCTHFHLSSINFLTFDFSECVTDKPKVQVSLQELLIPPDGKGTPSVTGKGNNAEALRGIFKVLPGGETSHHVACSSPVWYTGLERWTHALAHHSSSFISVLTTSPRSSQVLLTVIGPSIQHPQLAVFCVAHTIFLELTTDFCTSSTTATTRLDNSQLFYIAANETNPMHN